MNRKSMDEVRPQRRALMRLAALSLMAPLAPLAQAASPSKPVVQIWIGPSCGCCKDWIAYLQANGFQTQVDDRGNTDARERLGIKLEYGSCHTALVGGYALEGHVPAREIWRLLKERPKAIGLAVPAMPLGSPGMDGPEYRGRQDPYDVLLLAKDGSSRVYQSYP